MTKLRVFPVTGVVDYGAHQIPPAATSAGAGGVNTQDEGIAVDTPATTINFVGAGVTATGGAGTTTVTIPGGSGIAGITLKEEGSTVGTAAGITSIDVVGTLATATGAGAAGTITLASPLTTKGDLFGRTSSVDARVPVGATNGMFLSADSTNANGVSWVNPTLGGISLIGQALLGRIRFRLVLGINGTAQTAVGPVWATVVGSITSQNLDWTTPWLSIGKAILVSSGAAGNSVEWASGSVNEFALSSTAAFAGGFLYIARVGIHTHTATSRSFFGMKSTITALSNADPSSQVDMVGFGNDSADANFSIMCNDGSGTATKTTLGASFPAQTASADYYEFVLYAAPGQTSSVDWFATNIFTGATASGNLSSNLPTANLGLSVRAWLNNGTTAAVCRLGMQSIYVQSLY